MDPRDDIAVRLEVVAEQLVLAAEHARTAAEHFRQRRVAPGCAHKVAVDGHLVRVGTELDAIAASHAEHAEP